MDAQIARVEMYLQDLNNIVEDERPVLFFNASTRIHRLSLNAAFSLLASYALRASGQPIRHLVCQQGMAQCILGTHPQKPSSQPPCTKCQSVSRRIFPPELIIPVDLETSLVLEVQRDLESRSFNGLKEWVFEGIPLGQLILPGLQWVMRRHDLEDDERTRSVYKQYLSSAASLSKQFVRILDQTQPKSLVLFNGIFYPEALLRFVAEKRGIQVITHEVGLQPFSAFFSHKHATFREVEINAEDEITADEKTKLEAYLEARFQGKFSMAGIQFWETIETLPEQLSKRIGQYTSVVPVFTNVIFDTSQIHANALFPDMFTWLDELLELIDRHREVLFVIRAHPDENRPGKASEQSVSTWAQISDLDKRENVIFLSPEEVLSSYELIEQAKLVLVYNSSIGLEASIMGKPVLCAGRARYTQAETVFFPEEVQAYWVELERMLSEEQIKVPERMSINARKFLYHELFQASLDLSAFLKLDPTLPGMVSFKEFQPQDILKSPSLDSIKEGILHGYKFLLDGKL